MIRSRRDIQTVRGQLYWNPTAIRKPGTGSVSLDSGASGSVDALTVNSVSIITNAVSFNSTLAQTAIDLANEINDTDSTPNYYARPQGTTVYIFQETPASGTLTVSSTTTTISKTDTNLTGGSAGAGGASLGYTEAGVDFDPQTAYLDEVTDESGTEIVKVFQQGTNIFVRTVLKQRDQDTLNVLYNQRYDSTKDIVEFPGPNIDPGDDLTTTGGILEFRPDDTRAPAQLWYNAIPRIVNRVVTFRTRETAKYSLEFLCLPASSPADADQAVGVEGFAGQFTQLS